MSAALRKIAAADYAAASLQHIFLVGTLQRPCPHPFFRDARVEMIVCEYQAGDDGRYRDYLCDNPQRRCPDLAKLKSLGGWELRIKVREGLARTLQSYRETA